MDEIKETKPIDLLRAFLRDHSMIPSDPEVRKQMFAILEQYDSDLPFGDLVELAELLVATPIELRAADMIGSLFMVGSVELRTDEEAYARAAANARAATEGGEESAIGLLIKILKQEKTEISAEEEKAIDAFLSSLGMVDIEITMANLELLPEELVREMVEEFSEFSEELKEAEDRAE